jgi:hypothetical protein
MRRPSSAERDLDRVVVPLLAYTNLEDGELDERLRRLPLRAFADAARCLYELGWVTPSGSDDSA